MNIISQSDNLSPREIFRMMEEAEALKNYNGMTFDIDAYVLYEDIDKKTGEMRKILAIRTDSGTILGTNSATVIATFDRMLNALGFPIQNVQVSLTENKKSGRQFANLHLVD